MSTKEIKGQKRRAKGRGEQRRAKESKEEQQKTKER